jgi:hypothetical protein
MTTTLEDATIEDGIDLNAIPNTPSDAARAAAMEVTCRMLESEAKAMRAEIDRLCKPGEALPNGAIQRTLSKYFIEPEEATEHEEARIVLCVDRYTGEGRAFVIDADGEFEEATKLYARKIRKLLERVRGESR